MTVLSEKQFEILPHAEANDGFVFGIGADVSIDDEGFDPGDQEWWTQDAENTRRGVLGFGRDVASPRTWTWESHVDTDSVENAVDLLDDLSSYWRMDSLARTPGEVTAIRYRLAGRERRVFGRPRRFAAPPSNLIDAGYVPITHDFQCVDSFTYDDVESMVTINYSSGGAPGGGFTLPAAFPITTLSAEGTGSAQVTVAGTARAYPVIRFNGPWVNPKFITEDWTLSWIGSIAEGNWVEVDTRPWKQTVLNQDGGSEAYRLPRQTWIEDFYFNPKTQPQIALGGDAVGGSASAVVRWRNTWTSI